LQAKDDDPVELARFKQAAEGILLNSTIEAITHGVKSLRAAKNGHTGGAASVQKASTGAAETPKTQGDVVTVKPTEDGKWAVVGDLQKSQDNALPNFIKSERAPRAAS